VGPKERPDGKEKTAQAGQARGPLRIHPGNPRYFTDGSTTPGGSPRAVYLTGSHTWDNLVDMGRSDPPEAFDFDAYLDFLERHGHNFIRLWTWDSTLWDSQANGSLGKNFVHRASPLPWLRTGPENALDGKPRFDLTKFDPAYFERLRDRVKAAGRRGIYVSVMLFEGWGLSHGNIGRKPPDGWAWRSHPFHPANNVNGITPPGAGNLSGRVHALGNASMNFLQADYVRKVVDTVNDLDNVLYEVINEGGEKDWNRWVLKTVHDHERTKPKQHPIGLTGHGADDLASMVGSKADWVSPGGRDGYKDDPPAWRTEAGKPSLLDTDHIWGVGGSAAWVWKAFLRGHNPIFMDPYGGSVLDEPGSKKWESIRNALGAARRLALRLDLARMEPRNELASTGYCLAEAGKAYVVYLPAGSAVTVDLTNASGELETEWIRPEGGDAARGKLEAGAKRELTVPSEIGDGGAVVLIQRRAPEEL
jgi:hypothetical protein